MEYVGKIIFDELLYENRKFIIYGFGVQGKKIFEFLKSIGNEKNVVGFCDRDAASITNSEFLILHPDEAVKSGNVDFLVSGKHEYEMIQYLLANGVSRIHLLWM